MSQTPITITYSLEEVLKRFEQKLDNFDTKFTSKLEAMDAKFTGKMDKFQEEVTSMNIRLTKVETKLDTEVEAMKDDIKDIKGSQKAQIWTLIGILITVVAGFVIAVGRLVFFGSF